MALTLSGTLDAYLSKYDIWSVHFSSDIWVPFHTSYRLDSTGLESNARTQCNVGQLSVLLVCTYKYSCSKQHKWSRADELGGAKHIFPLHRG